MLRLFIRIKVFFVTIIKNNQVKVFGLNPGAAPACYFIFSAFSFVKQTDQKIKSNIVLGTKIQNNSQPPMWIFENVDFFKHV